MKIRQRVERRWPSWRSVRRWIQSAENHASLERGQSRSGSRRGSSTKLAGRAADEHVLGARVQHPIISFSRVVVMSGNFNETLVQREVVSDGILPTLFVVLVVRKMAHYVLVDSVQSEPFLRTLTDRHHNESVVTVRRLLALFLIVRLSILRVLLFGRVGRVDGVSGAVQGRRLGAAVPGHVEVARIFAIVDAADLRRRGSPDGRCRRSRARLRQDAANTETAFENNARRRRRCHRLLLARSFHIHHTFHTYRQENSHFSNREERERPALSQCSHRKFPFQKHLNAQKTLFALYFSLFVLYFFICPFSPPRDR